jgi:lysosomal Pro-X carboxypeptidase
VFQFRHLNVDEAVYDNIVTRSFVNAGCNFDTVTNAFVALRKLAKTDSGRQYINKVFNMDPKSILKSESDVDFLLAFIREAFESMAMVNYPYDTNFLMPLPGWPVKVACGYLNKSMTTEEEFATGLYQLVNLYYNYTGSVAAFCANAAVCGDSAYSALGSPLGWPWQTCTEMVMPLCGKGPPNDFFWRDCPFTLDGDFDSCNSTFGNIGYDREFLRPDWAMTVYGRRFRAVGNIIFSNGYLDPWSGGGYSLKPSTDGGVVSIIIEDGAHHYDLRAAHPLDTPAVQDARRLETIYIEKWIADATAGNKAPKNSETRKATMKKALEKYKLKVKMHDRWITA